MDKVITTQNQKFMIPVVISHFKSICLETVKTVMKKETKKQMERLKKVQERALKGVM